MATPLTLDVSHILATTIATANSLTAASGSPGNPQTTLVGTATGYGEIQQGGSAAAWPQLGSIGLPSGYGALYDVTLLELQTFLAGNWSSSWEGLASLGGLYGDLHQRAYKYNSGAYTLLTEMIVTGKNIGTTLATKATVANALAAIAFATGDKLYLDTWWNIVTNTTGSSLTTISTTYSSTANGNANYTLITPGYAPTAAGSDEVLERRIWWF